MPQLASSIPRSTTLGILQKSIQPCLALSRIGRRHYATVGLSGPASLSPNNGALDASLVQDVDQPITPFFQDDATLLLSKTVTGALWYVLNTAPNALMKTTVCW